MPADRVVVPRPESRSSTWAAAPLLRPGASWLSELGLDGPSLPTWGGLIPERRRSVSPVRLPQTSLPATRARQDRHRLSSGAGGCQRRSRTDDSRRLGRNPRRRAVRALRPADTGPGRGGISPASRRPSLRRDRSSSRMRRWSTCTCEAPRPCAAARRYSSLPIAVTARRPVGPHRAVRRRCD